MRAGTSDPGRELEDMTSNDSGVESSTDNDDCAQPKFNKRLVSSAEMSLVPVRRMKNQDFPLSLCLNSLSEPPIVFARPMLNEIPGRTFKCLFELANPTFPGTLDRFQSVSIASPLLTMSSIRWWLVIVGLFFVSRPVSDSHSRVHGNVDENGEERWFYSD